MVQEAQPLPYARRAFDEALAVIHDARSSPTDQRDAAYATYHLARGILPLDERTITDLMNAIVRRVADPQIVDALLRLVGDSGGDNLPRLAPALGRLLDLSHREHPGSLPVLVERALRVAAWRQAVQPVWLADVVTRRVAAGRRPAALLLLGLCVSHPALPECIRQVLTDHPTLLVEETLCPDTRWRLQSTAPTPEGWRVLASRKDEQWDELWRSAFAGTRDEAVASLEQAIESEPEGARRILLARWRVQLGEAGR